MRVVGFGGKNAAAVGWLTRWMLADKYISDSGRLWVADICGVVQVKDTSFVVVGKKV